MSSVQFYHFILFFDGECMLCNKTIQWILAHENDHSLMFCRLQSNYAHQLIPKNYQTIDSVLLWKNKKWYTHLDAILQLLPHLKWYWKCLYVFYLIPSVWRKKIYNWIATRRYQWFGPTSQCVLMMKDEWKNRLID